MIPINKAAWQERYLTRLIDNNKGNKGKIYYYWSLNKLAEDFQFNLDDLPFITKIFLENVLRNCSTNDTFNYQNVVKTIKNIVDSTSPTNFEFPFFPSRVLMQDYTGVPALVDLAAMRDAIADKDCDATIINPVCPVDLVIDHSLIADQAGSPNALAHNQQREMERNHERYQFLKWAQASFSNLTIIPPGRGICHQVNLEYLAQVVRDEVNVLIPDTLIGTDSHTTMINGLGVLGWGVGGIEAEAVMLGQPLSISAPQIVGVKLLGKMQVGTTATDLVLTITQILRNYGVVGKFVEFYGSGVSELSIADRATVANMAPEYGATCGLFHIDNEVIEYLKLTNRSSALVERVHTYTLAQKLWNEDSKAHATYPKNIVIDLNTIEPSIAGPKRPQDCFPLNTIKRVTREVSELDWHCPTRESLPYRLRPLSCGDIVIAAITSCTNTSNPKVMLQAGLLAKAAVERGLKINPNVKTSLAPGSQVVARYLNSTGLQQYLDKLGFNCIGFGCTTCIGNSGPLDPDIEQQISEGNLNVGAVLSGNRNFEGRIHPSVRLNWLMSPPLVIAFALVGHTRINFDNEPLGIDKNGQPTFLRDIWPNDYLVNETMRAITKESYALSYQDMLVGDHAWEDLPISNTDCYPWNSRSTYIIQPPFLELLAQTGHEGLNSCNQVHGPIKIKSANILAIFGDSITTDHISPAGQISPYSPAGKYLIAKGVTPEQLNSYGARRGNHEVMVRGTFANNRLQNEIIAPKQGGITRIFDDKYLQNKAHVSIFEASEYYAKSNIPLVIFAGKEYGTGSSRDWAAKGCQLLGVQAVIAESFERIHRSNLVGMGIMPLQLPKGTSVESLHLQGNELVDVIFDNNNSSHRLAPNQTLLVTIHSTANDETKGAVTLPVVLRINSSLELDYFIAGGVLPYVANQYL
ncbi:aconitate hydratase AcnA [Shewanella waksmanii]|uniref:aconitate hydratase AcnA n=1 Tax=Shewanella waksmanii TaxID=213783 RepID=UPI000490D6A3|nr:aconitate hydratase AcnA [Shewanella waksmanii]